MSELRFELQSFPKNVCDAFVCFQQNGDFVDMTLAAEGHLVNVHKNILSVSSPYIEAMLKSIPCKHPVIFLSNVSREVLGYILEYVYTGVTKVPKDRIDQFAAACKQLQIVALMDYEDTIVDASVKLNKSKKDNKYKTHSTINKPRPTKTYFNIENESKENKQSQTNDSINRNDGNSFCSADETLFDSQVNVPNMSNDTQNKKTPIQTKKRKSNSVIPGSSSKQIKFSIDLSKLNTNGNGLELEEFINSDQPNYQIDDVSNARSNMSTSICNNSEKPIVEKSKYQIDLTSINEPVAPSNMSKIINDTSIPNYSETSIIENSNYRIDLTNINQPMALSNISKIMNDTSIPNNSKYRIDLTNINQPVMGKFSCSDIETSDSDNSKQQTNFTLNISGQPMSGKSIDNSVLISEAVNSNPTIESQSTIEDTHVQTLASLTIDPVDGTLKIIDNNYVSNTENIESVPNNVEDPIHAETCNSYADMTNWLQINKSEIPVAVNTVNTDENGFAVTNNATDHYTISRNTHTNNISNGTAKTLIFDKNTGFLVPISELSESMDTGNCTNVSPENDQDQSQHECQPESHSNPGCSYSEYRSKILEDAKPLYTLSNRGSLQMFLNRFSYGLHHSSKKKRRWRCIQYRVSHCPAFVDTVGEEIIRRSHGHAHPFHDSKILRKGQKDAVFAKISQALKYAIALQREVKDIRNQEDYKRDLAMLIVKEDELNSKDET